MFVIQLKNSTLIRKIKNLIKAKCRRIYWKLNIRNDNLSEPLDYPDPTLVFWDLVNTQINQYTKSIIEIGCSNGRDIVKLASLYKGISFYGVDIQKKAIYYAKKRNSNSNLNFYCCDILSLKTQKIMAESDITLSCMSLIYLNSKEIKIFFQRIENDIIFCEITSLIKDVIIKGYYIHPYIEIIKEIMPNYEHKIIYLNYSPWQGFSDTVGEKKCENKSDFDYIGCIHILKKKSKE